MISKLRSRLKKKAKKPGFSRQEGYRFKKLGGGWRRPRGRHSKLRKGKQSRGKKPSIGYGTRKEFRGLTKGGLRPVIVSNPTGLEGLDPKRDAVVIGSAVGGKKRAEIIKEAEKGGIKLLNAYKYKLTRAE